MARNDEEKYADIKIFDPPATGAHDDPRKVIWFNVDDVVIDQNTQRTVLPGRVDALAGDWKWALAETILITVRDDDTLAVTEGQNRVTARQKSAPGSHMWGVISPDSNESRVALGIAKGRRPHTSFDKWRLRLHDRDERVLAAEQVLALMDPPLRLSVQSGRTGYAIAAVGAVDHIMDSSENVAEAAQLLRTVLRVLTKAWPYPTEKRRLDARLLDALRHLFIVNDNVDERHLIEVLQSNTAQRWFLYGTERGAQESAYSAVGRAIVKAYNFGKRSDGNRKIDW